MFESGKYPVLNGGTSFSGYYDEFNTEANTITVSQGGASAGFVNYITEPFWAGAHCFIVNPISNDILKKYIFFFLKNCQTQIMNAKLGAGIPGLNRKELFGISVPVPPLPVQEEIVRILDRFDALVNDISIGLPAELSARRKQYEYYRNRLLTFERR